MQYLDDVLLQSECVDDLEHSRLLREHADSVRRLVPPPGSARLVHPVARRLGRRHVHEATVGSVRQQTAAYRVHVRMQLFTHLQTRVYTIYKQIHYIQLLEYCLVQFHLHFPKSN